MNKTSKYEIIETDGVIVFKNQNTTLGFVRFNSKNEIEYIYVNASFRRQGLAKKLLKLIKEKNGKDVLPQTPISPLGKKLFNIV